MQGNEADIKDRLEELERANVRLQEAEKSCRISEEKYIQVVENSLTGIYIDQNARIVFANTQFAEIYGYSKDEILGIDPARLVHPDDRELTSAMREKRLQGGPAPAVYEARGLTRDGRTIWVRRRNVRIVHEGSPAVLGNVEDVTAQKQAEERLRSTNEELNDFVRVVFHDLKTPLISIQGFSQRLLDRYLGVLDEKGAGYLRRIVESAARMDSLILELRELNRAGKMTADFAEIESGKVVDDALSDLGQQLQAKNAEVSLPKNLPRIRCDERKIYQVFANLIANAVKYADPERPLRISIDYAEEGGFHRFCITDNGIGIDPKYAETVFEQGTRVEETGETSGSGLGLAITRRIVRLHGGEAWVDSEKGEGATFCFTLRKKPESTIQTTDPA